jgi:hypothetical protein
MARKQLTLEGWEVAVRKVQVPVQTDNGTRMQDGWQMIYRDPETGDTIRFPFQSERVKEKIIAGLNGIALPSDIEL